MYRTMLDWLQYFRPKKPLSGAPAAPRQKTYSAMSGYAYQYFYEGQRDVKEGIEFVFDVSADRKTSFHLSILIRKSALTQWERSHERLLESNERYAVAKLALFRAFDETDTPKGLHKPVRVDAKQVEEILESLDLD
jgi:hypothetical protein